MIEDIGRWLSSLSELLPGPPLAYLVIFALAVADVFLPVLPSEAPMLLGGVLAGTGRLDLGLVLASGALGAFVGDNAAYWVGRGVGPRMRGWMERGGAAKRVAWAEAQLAERGGFLIVVGQFFPYGRTTIALAAGVLRMAWSRYLAFSALAALIWATQAAVPGYIGGTVFQENPWLGFALGFAIVAAAAGILAFIRAVRNRRRERQSPAE